MYKKKFWENILFECFQIFDSLHLKMFDCSNSCIFQVFDVNNGLHISLPRIFHIIVN